MTQNLAEKLNVGGNKGAEGATSDKSEGAKLEGVNGTGAVTVAAAKQNASQLFAGGLISKVAKETLTAIPLTAEELAARKEGDTAEVKMVAVKRNLTNEELVAAAEESAPRFIRLGELGDEIEVNSSDMYAFWGPIFPVRNGINGKPDTAELVKRIWAVTPEKYKTPSPTVAGKFMTCESAAREARNQCAKGILAMKRWCDRNSGSIFAHLGAKPLNEEQRRLQKVEAAIKTLSEYADGVVAANPDAFRFVRLDENNDPILDDATGEPKIFDLRDVLTAVNTEVVLNELEGEKKKTQELKDAEKKRREAEETATPEGEEVVGTEK